uniref:transposase n=1 Tax=Huintestinicola sp. TaxID=2981661 RepID=UPI003D7D44FE
MPRRSHKNKKYSTELRLKAVKEYLNGGGSQLEICKKYEILSDKQLRNWILWYNGH